MLCHVLIIAHNFTASMEANLDRIATGREDRVAWLTLFYTVTDFVAADRIPHQKLNCMRPFVLRVIRLIMSLST